LLFCSYRPRPVSFGIDDAEEAKRLIMGIEKPVRRVRLYIKNVERTHRYLPSAQQGLPFSPYGNYHVFMLMGFVTAESPGTQLKVSKVKFNSSPLRSDQHLPRNAGPVITAALVPFNGYSFPRKPFLKRVQLVAIWSPS